MKKVIKGMQWRYEAKDSKVFEVYEFDGKTGYCEACWHDVYEDHVAVIQDLIKQINKLKKETK